MFLKFVKHLILKSCLVEEVKMDNVCIAISNQKEYMEFQRLFFRIGITWENNCELVFDDCTDVSHLVVDDGVLYNNYVEDGDPTEVGFDLITWDMIK